MSEAKHPAVIHDKSQKIVTAFKLENDITWVGKEKDKLIALPIYCKENQKIEMTYVKSFIRKSGTLVIPHFRKKSGEPEILNEIGGESMEHREAKEYIYKGIYSEKIKIDGQILDKNLIEDIKLEYRTSSRGYVIPDVIILLKDVHPKYGLGIFIEIQFSDQKEEITQNRSYERVIRGFSGIWLNKKDFINGKLNRDNLEIEGHKKLLSKLENLENNKFISKLNRYGELIDEKLNNFDYQLEKKFNKEKDKIVEIHNYYKGSIERSKDEVQESFNEKIENLKLEQEKLEKLKTEFNNLDVDLTPYVERLKVMISEDTKLWADIIVDAESKIKEMIRNDSMEINHTLYEKLLNELTSKLNQDKRVEEIVLNYHTKNLTKKIQENIELTERASTHKFVRELVVEHLKQEKKEINKIPEVSSEKFYCGKCGKHKSIYQINYDEYNDPICWDCVQLKKKRENGKSC